MGKVLKIFISIIIAAAIFSSCNTSGCMENGSAIPLAGLYDSSTNNNISLDSLEISGVGAPNDSILLFAGSNVSKVYLPMHAGHDVTSWALAYRYKYLEGVTDTITLKYETVPYFASAECGAMYIYRVNDIYYTTNLIDSVTMPDPMITNVDIETIRIYFRTAAEEGPDQ